MVERFQTGDARELSETVHALGLTSSEYSRRIEVSDLAGDPRLKAFGVERADVVDTRFPINEVFPSRFRGRFPKA